MTNMTKGSYVGHELITIQSFYFFHVNIVTNEAKYLLKTHYNYYLDHYIYILHLTVPHGYTYQLH